MNRPLLALLLAAALCWHLLAVLANGWAPLLREDHGRDFASYFYAMRVAADGGDPYERAALVEAARQDEVRVHPYFYPPPFLLGMVWTVPLDLVSAWRAWFWLNALFLWAAVLALWRWWRPLGPAVGPVLVVAVALSHAVPDNLLMGQANLPVLALVAGGLWAAERRPWLGGALLGAACMAKMSPALFVAWWLLHRRWRPVAAACLTAAALSLLALPLVGPSAQLRFYTEVLPSFSSGAYHGLTVPIDLFGNHSLPNLYDQWFPGDGRELSGTARALSTLTAVALLTWLGWSFRHPPADLLARGAQVAAVAVLMLLVPVYTYEHHLVWALPAVAIASLGVLHGRLGTPLAVAVGAAVAAWAFHLQRLRVLSLQAFEDLPWLSFAVQEAKTAALLVLLGVCVRLGRGR